MASPRSGQDHQIDFFLMKHPIFDANSRCQELFITRLKSYSTVGINIMRNVRLTAKNHVLDNICQDQDHCTSYFSFLCKIKFLQLVQK